jgi:hypothetical protein
LALREVEQALQLTAAGSHQVWSWLAVCHLLVLDDLGHHAQAVALAERYLGEALAELGEQPAALRLAQALVLAQSGSAAAAQQADVVIAEWQAAGVTGLWLGFAHEIRARIALAFTDLTGFEQHVQACQTAYCAHGHHALKAKLERLRQRALKPGNGVLTQTPETYATTRISTALERCRDAEQRARVSLSLIARQSGASAGFLFAVGSAEDEAPECIATLGKLALSDELAQGVQAYIEAQLVSGETTSTGQSAEALAGQADHVDVNGQRYLPVLLSHASHGETFITGVALLARPEGARLVYPAQLAVEISRFRAFQAKEPSLAVQD